tara:strand:- start:883 stop:1485 length:603 start_codon:yes stop_codon:yes gene_type:complete
MTSYDAYRLYLAIKLHFTTENYDFFKHNAKVNSTLNTFLKRNDRFFFHKLATKYNNEELMMYFVSNFLEKTKTWVGDLVREDGENTYNRWKKYNEAFSYNFRADCSTIHNYIDNNSIHFNDIFTCDSGQHPKMLRLFLSKQIRIETIIIFNQILSFLKKWDKQISESVVWPDISKKIKKYSPFVKYNLTKCKFIMKEIFV